ncbi:MAG: 3'-5' exoribonuclease, partial [Haliea sp.]
VLLEAMLKKFNVSVPWKYWNVRDTRTIYDEWGIDIKSIPMPETMVAHNALDDAAWDAWLLQRTIELAALPRDEKTYATFEEFLHANDSLR